MEARVQSIKKERGVNSHDFNKLNKTNMLSAKISKEYKNSGISTPSVNIYIYIYIFIYFCLTDIY